MPFNKRVRVHAFTIAELMVSVAILIIISTSVVTDITRTRYQEELISSARLVVSGMRDLQSMALAASSVKTCIPSIGVTAVCEMSATICGGTSCSGTISPSVFGATFVSGASQFTTFADVNGTSNYREDGSGYERIQAKVFPRPNPSTAFVTITGLSADGAATTPVTVTFDRQRGRMRINACLSGGCTPAEASVLSITLTHARTGKTKIIYFNVVTGKIEIQ